MRPLVHKLFAMTIFKWRLMGFGTQGSIITEILISFGGARGRRGVLETINRGGRINRFLLQRYIDLPVLTYRTASARPRCGRIK